MANFKSDQRTNATAEPRVINSPQESHGRKRVMVWTFTTPASMVINDTVELGTLPKNVRVMKGRLYHGTMGASATVSIGIVGTLGKYGSAIIVTPTGEKDYANTIAFNALSKTTIEELLLASDTGANWASGQVFHGELEYVQD